MLAGRRLLESLIVLCKIEVENTIKQINVNNEIDYKMISAKEIEQELTTNKNLIKMTNGREDGESSGSDSEPSADNLDAEEMEKICPVEKKPKTKVVAAPLKKVEPPKKEPPKTPPKKVIPIVKEVVRSPTKKPSAYNPFDRLSLRKRKPEMKDAWTQTTPRARDERRAKRHRE